MTDTVSGLDIATLVIAVAGLVTAAVSLSWQVVVHRLTGSRVRVELVMGALAGDAYVSGPAATFDPASLIAQGFGPLVVGVRGRNVGRLAVDITHWDIYTGDGFGYTLPGYPLNPNLPHRLEPGSTVTFLYPIDHVRALITSKAAIGKTDQRIRGALSLGTGDVCHSDLVSPRGVTPADAG